MTDGILATLGRLLHVRTDEVECVLRTDAQRARETVRMQRRGFLGVAATLAAAPFVPGVWSTPEALLGWPSGSIQQLMTFSMSGRITVTVGGEFNPSYVARFGGAGSATYALAWERVDA